MRIKALHSWNLPPAEAVRLQKELAAQIRPEPTRLAHLFVNRVRREAEENDKS